MQKKISLLLCSAFLTTVLMAQNPKPQPPPPPPPQIEKDAPPALPKENRDFLRKNPTIENIQWSQSGKKLHIEYKSGRKEVYNLQTDADVKKALPGDQLPPPPPPVPSTN